MVSLLNFVMHQVSATASNEFSLTLLTLDRRSSLVLLEDELDKELSTIEVADVELRRSVTLNPQATSIHAYLKNYLNDPEYSDIIIVSEGNNIHCHKGELIVLINL